MKPIEAEGSTVADAVEAALRESGLRRDQVEIIVTQEGAPGFMGLGSKPARIRLMEKHWSPDSPAPSPRVRRENAPAPPRPAAPVNGADACANAQNLVIELLRLMAIASPSAAASWDPDLERVKVAVESQDAPLLVGRDGRALESLQFLVTLMLSRGGAAPLAVQVDALSYWEKRERAVLEEAHRAVTAVKATGRPVRMEPMDASLRRLIHRTLASNPEVVTASEGEGPWRKLVIRPRAK
ncbi:MAG: Jag N-terminal domain-containing protein [Elusimicrobia bacterium]|nr:Jag N-terminal domain-containing protein [Elusimicrobiota bacterium]